MKEPLTGDMKPSRPYTVFGTERLRTASFRSSVRPLKPGRSSLSGASTAPVSLFRTEGSVPCSPATRTGPTQQKHCCFPAGAAHPRPSAKVLLKRAEHIRSTGSRKFACPGPGQGLLCGCLLVSMGPKGCRHHSTYLPASSVAIFTSVF